MSLLDELRSDPQLIEEAPSWVLLRDTLPLIVPRCEVKRMEVFNTGRVTVRGRSPLGGRGLLYFAAELDGRNGSPMRPVYLSLSRYRDEAEAGLIHKPFAGRIAGEPGAMTAWLAGVLLTRTLADTFTQPLRSFD